jgi:hypothetical protein
MINNYCPSVKDAQGGRSSTGAEPGFLLRQELAFAASVHYNRPMPFPRLRYFFDQAKFKARIWRALHSGPPYPPRPDRIIIDLSHCCDLNCPDCNRSCGADQAPAEEFISLEQIRRFVFESIAAGRRWRRIMLEGGEPTLHPQLDEILDELLRYRSLHSPACKIELCTNGSSARTQRILRGLPPCVQAKNSVKSPGRHERHFSFNIAPVDLPEFAGDDYGRGCYIQHIFGLGLTRNGYYPHPICGGIDRVFGFDVGLKSLPAPGAGLARLMRQLCPLCGHFREFPAGGRGLLDVLKHAGKDKFPPGHKSPSWIRAYRDFRKNRPRLSLY